MPVFTGYIISRTIIRFVVPTRVYALLRSLHDRLCGETVKTSGMVAGMYWYQYEAYGDTDMKVRRPILSTVWE